MIDIALHLLAIYLLLSLSNGKRRTSIQADPESVRKSIEEFKTLSWFRGE